MLSPLDLQNKKVVTKKKRYEKAEMDEYLDLVFENYKELFNENQELQKKVKTLSDGIQYYRSIESTMQKALVLAEKTSKETKDAAILKAEAIEKDANSKAEKIIAEAEQEYDKMKEKCLYLVQQFNKYKTQLKQVATAQLKLVTSDSFDVDSPEIVSPDLSESSPDRTARTQSRAARQTGTEQLKKSAERVRQEPEKASRPTPPEKSDDTAKNNLEKTMVVPDIKPELAKKASVSAEEELSILTADTIDLSNSISQVQKKTNSAADSAANDLKPDNIADNASNDLQPDNIADNASNDLQTNSTRADSYFSDLQPDNAVGSASNDLQSNSTRADSYFSDLQPDNIADSASNDLQPDNIADNTSNNLQPNNIADNSNDLQFEDTAGSLQADDMFKGLLPDDSPNLQEKNAAKNTRENSAAASEWKPTAEEQQNNIVKPQEATPKSVKDATVVKPVDATPSAPLEIKLQSVKDTQTEVLEPVPENTKDAPTLDSLLQSMNMSKKKKKKGQEEDPFEFLGSVDDF